MSNIALSDFILQVAEYRAAQEAAKRSHANMWMYGDITEDDAEEFGLGR
jgi:staphylococcal nuclease domain-containing protein 1